jgi:hypothetical protein
MIPPPGAPLWPEPHDVRFDFAASASGAERIDALAMLAAQHRVAVRCCHRPRRHGFGLLLCPSHRGWCRAAPERGFGFGSASRPNRSAPNARPMIPFVRGPVGRPKRHSERRFGWSAFGAATRTHQLASLPVASTELRVVLSSALRRTPTTASPTQAATCFRLAGNRPSAPNQATRVYLTAGSPRRCPYSELARPGVTASVAECSSLAQQVPADIQADFYLPQAAELLVS